MSNLDDQFQDYTPEVADKEIEEALKKPKFPKVKNGWYMLRVLGGDRQIADVTRGASGRAMAVEEFGLLRPSDKQISAVSMKKWHMLPIVPRPEWLAGSGYDGYDAESKTVIPDSQIDKLLKAFNADGTKKIYLNNWRRRLRAGFGKEAFPNYPAPVEGSNYTSWTLNDGTVVDADTAEVEKGKLIKAVKLAAHEFLKNPSLTKGQEFYAKIEYKQAWDKVKKQKSVDAEGKPIISDFPDIDWFTAEPPTDKDGNAAEVLDPFVSVI